jgi:hypothetical protein
MMFIDIPNGIGMRLDETGIIVIFHGRQNAENEFPNLEIWKMHSASCHYHSIIRSKSGTMIFPPIRLLSLNII